MKREAHTHPKVLEFIDWIDEQVGDELRKIGAGTKALAKGMLDELWNLAHEHAPQGDVGKFTNKRIARTMAWFNDPDELVEILVECRLLDQSDEHRLIIHDWPEHCGDYVHNRLARNGLYFADGTAPKVSRLPKEERQKIEKSGHYSSAQEAPAERSVSAQERGKALGKRSVSAHKQLMSAEPSLAKPSQSLAKPSPTRGGARGAPDGAAAAAGVEFLIEGGSRTWAIPDGLAEQLAEDFPDVDLGAALGSLADWTARTRPKMGAAGMETFLRKRLAEEPAKAQPQPEANGRPVRVNGRLVQKTNRPLSVEFPDDVTDEDLMEGFGRPDGKPSPALSFVRFPPLEDQPGPLR